MRRLDILKSLKNLKEKLEILSIKRLTILGFSLVSLPLLLGLIVGAIRIEQLAQQGTNSIFHAAELVEVNKKLNEIVKNMERNASQAAVLDDSNLSSRYFEWEGQLKQLVVATLVDHPDSDIAIYSKTLLDQANEFSSLFNKNILTLDDIQRGFVKLRTTSDKIRARTDDLIQEHASQMQQDAESVRTQLIYGLILLPITVFIALVFIVLITSPMRRITNQIKRLERGNFEQKISLKGSPEIVEIADALETMRLRLHALELQKSSFIRHISHELKTPLAAIREGAELLYDNSVGELTDSQREVSNIIRSSVARLQILIEDLLDFNIVLDSTSLQDNEIVEILPVIEQVLDEHKLDIKRKQLTIDHQVPYISLKSNSQQLKVVIDNLVTNAINYAPTDSQITLAAQTSGKALVFSVTDQGPGIDENIKQKVFEAFYQGPPPIEGQVKSSGLGLTIVQELLQRLNGSIKLKNNPMGTGTKVEIHLPRASME